MLKAMTERREDRARSERAQKIVRKEMEMDKSCEKEQEECHKAIIMCVRYISASSKH
jgi:hypothetical protein